MNTKQTAEIRMIRLNTGEDIIASCLMEVKENLIVLSNPMRVILRRIGERNQSMLIMMPWLPLELIEEDMATINYNDVITIFKPKDSFVEYYQGTVEQYHKSLNDSEEFDFEDNMMEESYDEDELEEDDVMEELQSLTKVKKNLMH
jgi:hypothetical protein